MHCFLRGIIILSINHWFHQNILQIIAYFHGLAIINQNTVFVFYVMAVLANRLIVANSFIAQLLK